MAPLCRQAGALAAAAGPHHPDGQALRARPQPASGSLTSASGSSAPSASEALGCREGAGLAPRWMCAAASRTGRRAFAPDWCISPGQSSVCAFPSPGTWSAGPPGRPRPAAGPGGGPAAGRPVHRRAHRLVPGRPRPARRLRRRPPDVMDTWATSAITPRSPAAGSTTPTCSPACSPWTCGPRATTSSAPVLFYSLVRAHTEHGTVPWAHAVIAGWVVDPQPAQAGQVRGDALTPSDALERFGADALRYWAAISGPGSTPSWTRASCGSGGAWPPSCCTPAGSRSPRTVSVPPRPARPSTGPAGPAGRGGGRGHRRLRGLRAGPGPGGHRGLLLVVLRPLPGAGQGPGLRRGRPGRPGLGRRSCAWPSTPWSACSPRAAVRHRGDRSWWHDGSVHTSPWPEPGPLRAATGVERRPPAPGRRHRRPHRDPPVQDRRQALLPHPRRPGSRSPTPPERLAALSEIAPDLRRAGAITDLVLASPTDSLVVGAT